jgi:hypothetical protein
MGYGHGLILNGSGDGPKKSEFIAGVWVSCVTKGGRRVCGQVVGPDQNHFPSPLSVFVSFPSGFTHLLNVKDLELVEE